MISVTLFLILTLFCGIGLMWGVFAITEDTKNCSETVQSCLQALLIMATLCIVIPLTFYVNDYACPGGIIIDSSHQSFNKWIGFLVFIGLIGAATTALLAVIRSECDDAKNTASKWMFITSVTVTSAVIVYIIGNVIWHAKNKGVGLPPVARFGS